MQTSDFSPSHALKIDLNDGLHRYVSDRGTQIHEKREHDVLVLKNMIKHAASKPVLMSMVREHLAKLAMPLSPYKLYLCYRNDSKLRNGLNEVLKFHKQQSIIDRLKKKIKAADESQKRLRMEYQQSLKTLQRQYQTKAQAMQKALQDTQRQFLEFMNMVQQAHGLPVPNVQQTLHDAKGQHPQDLKQHSVPQSQTSHTQFQPPLPAICADDHKAPSPLKASIQGNEELLLVA